MLSNHSVSLGPTALVADSLPLVEVGQAVRTQRDPMRLPQQIASLFDRQMGHHLQSFLGDQPLLYSWRQHSRFASILRKAKHSVLNPSFDELSDTMTAPADILADLPVALPTRKNCRGQFF